MKDDYYRYLAEVATGEAKSKAVEDARIIDDLSSVDWKGSNYELINKAEPQHCRWCARR